jgi:hypothetical protein
MGRLLELINIFSVFRQLYMINLRSDKFEMCRTSKMRGDANGSRSDEKRIIVDIKIHG